MKKKIALIFGGESFEHEVSIQSVNSILNEIDKKKYDIKCIYIDKIGNWYLCEKDADLNVKKEIENINILKQFDCIFPILHGNYGEDGKIQGLFEMLHVPYVGCGVLSSALCMDKELAKKILKENNIPQAKSIKVTKDTSLKEISKKVRKKIGYPCFIKPANAGSSIGIHKVYHKEELENAIKDAFLYDKKVLIEKYIKGRELEVAAFGNDEPIISNVGEIFSGKDFYSYEAKYACCESKTKVPANLTKKQRKKILEYAKKAYLCMECRGLSRIDFFLSKTGKIYLNEINTMPGFTKISMYPKLLDEIGVSYSVLIDMLLELAIESY